jgi:hypothetical protein
MTHQIRDAIDELPDNAEFVLSIAGRKPDWLLRYGSLITMLFLVSGVVVLYFLSRNILQYNAKATIITSTAAAGKEYTGTCEVPLDLSQKIRVGQTVLVEPGGVAAGNRLTGMVSYLSPRPAEQNTIAVTFRITGDVSLLNSYAFHELPANVLFQFHLME